MMIIIILQIASILLYTNKNHDRYGPFRKTLYRLAPSPSYPIIHLQHYFCGVVVVSNDRDNYFSSQKENTAGRFIIVNKL